MRSRSWTRLLTALVLTTAIAPAAEAGWLHQENSAFQAKTASQRHPKSLDQTLVLPRTSVQPRLCVAYSRNAISDKRSRVVTKVEIEAPDGSVQKVKLIARVRNDRGVKCKTLGDKNAGTTFTFRHTFKKVPRLRAATGAERESMIVAGIVSTVGSPEIGASALALAAGGTTPRGLGQGDKGGWFHSANSVFLAEQNGARHPQTLTRVIVVPEATDTRPLVCAAYDRSTDVDGGGRGVTEATIVRDDSTVEILRISADVENDSYLSCKEAQRKLEAGDIVSFETTFESMPLMKAGTFADLIGAVATAGRPQFPNRRAPSNVLSIADEQATARLMEGRRQQLVLERDASPTKFLVFGPKTRLDSRRDLIPSTVGYGDTIADALADYERKQGSLGGTARRLTASELDAIVYFSKINPSGGGTAIRKDASGGFNCDLYRPNLGVRKGGPFGSLAATVNWMKSLGL